MIEFACLYEAFAKWGELNFLLTINYHDGCLVEIDC
ncbi:hypothetical protein J2W95_000251 [Flavobacterium granuli]|uniref:Uncharacterized protein n=1 Tax=Flavobacterium granuli TaxID=280093 RepID=A0ABU1RXT6_9FLAO|nr:hypothetical protein [Flavobacterium granuli]